jgi:hypothetical protein
LNDNWLKHSVGKLLHLERQELVLDHSISESERAIFIIFEISKLINIKGPDISKKVFVDIMVAISTGAILWLISVKIDPALELLGYFDKLELADVGVATPGQFSQILLIFLTVFVTFAEIEFAWISFAIIEFLDQYFVF